MIYGTRTSNEGFERAEKKSCQWQVFPQKNFKCTKSSLINFKQAMGIGQKTKESLIQAT